MSLLLALLGGGGSTSGDATASPDDITLVSASATAYGGSLATSSPASLSIASATGSASAGGLASCAPVALSITPAEGSAATDSGAIAFASPASISIVPANGFSTGDGTSEVIGGGYDRFGDYPYRRKSKKKKSQELKEITESVEQKTKPIIVEKVSVQQKIDNVEPESSEYWSLYLYEYLLNEQIAKINTDVLLQRINQSAINALRQKSIEEALCLRQLKIENNLRIEYERIMEEDLIFVLSIMAEL